MNRKETLQAATAVALVMGLVGCNGGNPISTFGGALDRTGAATGTGGSGGTLGGSNQGGGNYDLQAGIAYLVVHGMSANVTLSGSVSANGTQSAITGAGVFTLSAGVVASFDNVSALSQPQAFTGTASAGAQSITVNETLTSYYTNNSSSAYLGQVTGSEYDVAQAAFQYPTSVTAGMTGSLGTVLRYTDSTKSVPLGSAQVTYEIEAATTTGGPVGVVITSKVYDTTSALLETDSTAYQLTSDNVLTWVGSESMNVASQLIMLAN